MKKNDWLLAAAIAVAAVLILCVQLFRGTSEDAFVSVTVDGELFGTYRLDQDQTVSVNDTNRLVIGVISGEVLKRVQKIGIS